MARLKRLGASLAMLAPDLPMSPHAGPERDRWRARHQPWRAWYRTARWQRLRWQVLERDLFTCRRCGRIEADTSRLVCDHVEPHRGDEARFWSGPFQTLCKGCHDQAKQADEQQG